MKIKEAMKKFWNFVWKEDSLASWIVSLILIFVIIKFVFFPLLSLILGCSFPLVIVESSSMHHSGSFIGNVILSESAVDMWWAQQGKWYQERGMTRQDIHDWGFRTGIEKGDVVVVVGVKPEKLKVGDVIIFNANQKHPLIHRIVAIKEKNNTRYFETKGDNNSGQLPYEKKISETQILGKAVARVPKVGWIKLIFTELFK